MTAPLDIDHPWPGPESFRTEDAPFFRGRDSEIKQLLQLLHRAQSVVLYGASGLGKTSLINAGVVPRLPAGELFAVPIRVSYVAGAPSASDQIQAEIVKSRGGAGVPRPRPGRTAWELLHLRDEPIEGAQPLLIFDQLEELFTIGAGTPQAAQLIEELKGLIEGVPPASVRARLEQHPEEARSLAFQRRGHRVLLSVREDFLYGLESLRAQLPSLIHNRFRLEPLGGAMALEVVLQRRDAAGDGGAAGAPVGAPLGAPLVAPLVAPLSAPLVAPEVAELIVRTVASSVPDDRPLDALEVEPALLSILCAELARRRPPGTPITRELVTGSRADIISSFYERALQGAPDAVRAYIEDELVTATGYRTSAVLAEALAVPGFTGEVLSELINRRLLRVIERPKGKWLELTHDILTEIAVGSRRLRHERKLLAEQARLREEQLEAERRAERDRRLQAEARAGRRFKRLAALLATALVATAAMSVLAFTQAKLATRAREAADIQREAADIQRQRAHAQSQEATRQAELATRARVDAEAQRELAERLLRQTTDGIRMKLATLAGDRERIRAYLDSDLANRTIRFTASRQPLGYRDGRGRTVYKFTLSPERTSLPGGEAAVAMITYRMDHETFRNTLLATGPDRNFTATYDGWGCLTSVVALIEYMNPDRSPQIAAFDMCAAIEQAERSRS